MTTDGKKKNKMTRGEFLKLGGAGAAALAFAGAAKHAAAAGEVSERIAAGRRLAMVIDLRRCIGCHSCSVACKAEFDTPLGVWQSWVKEVEVGSYPNVKRVFLPRLCNHCENPPCVSVCPTTASHVAANGTVQISKKKCIGCRLCLSACPYDARFSHPVEKVATKCSFCIHRVEQGVVPSCVNTCQAKARIFGDLNDPKSEVAKLVAKEAVQVLKPEQGTEPQVFYIAADKAAMGRIREVS